MCGAQSTKALVGSAAVLWFFAALATAGAQAPLPGARQSPFVPAPAPAAQPAPCALLTGLEGRASVQRADGTRRLAVLDALLPNDELRLAADARVELVVTVGQQRVFSLKGPGRFQLSKGAVLALDRNSFVAVRDLVGDWGALRLRPGLVGRASVSLRGAPDTSLAIRAPLGGQRAAQIDTLRWEVPYGRRTDHWRYSVAVIDMQGRAVFSADTADTVLPLPRNIAWSRGQTYVWTVAATSDDGLRTDGSAEFRVVSQDVEESVDAVAAAAVEAHRRLAVAALLAEDVLYALLLDQSGLRQDADHQWHSLALARPAFAAWSRLDQ
jgi:hypothetical protein